jgi:hypothetical protein
MKPTNTSVRTACVGRHLNQEALIYTTKQRRHRFSHIPQFFFFFFLKLTELIKLTEDTGIETRRIYLRYKSYEQKTDYCTNVQLPPKS